MVEDPFQVQASGKLMSLNMDGLSSESGEDSSSGRSSSRRIGKNTDEYRNGGKVFAPQTIYPDSRMKQLTPATSTTLGQKGRRERNNLAVKKSRMKTKMKTQQMMDRVSQLKSENDELEENIKILTKELGILKDMFVAHAGNAHGVKLNDADLVKMLCEDNDVDEGVSLLMSLSQGPPL